MIVINNNNDNPSQTSSSSSSSSSSSMMKKRSSSSSMTEELPPVVVGEEITHHTHSKHPLAQVTIPDLFTCGGCKEYGAGKRYTCQQCDFQLHDFCALSPPILNNHPLHAQHHHLLFHPKPKPAKAGISWPRCDVCGKSTKGFVFRCRACSFQMHPCCAMLSPQISFPAHPHPYLRLLPSSIGAGAGASNNNETGTAAACGECKKKRSRSRMYRCTVCEYYLHAVCAKPLVNGLQANGIPTPPDKNRPSMLGTAARLASQVVIEFIGGLIEGLGEGMGEALLQNRGRGNRRR